MLCTFHLLSALPSHCQEVLKYKVADKLIQNYDYDWFSQQLTVRLDDNSTWQLFPLGALGAPWCGYFSETYDEIDSRLIDISSYWIQNISPVEVYRLNYSESKACELRAGGSSALMKATHVLFHRKSNQMVFARQIKSSKLSSNYAVLPPSYNSTLFHHIIGHNYAKYQCRDFIRRMPGANQLIIKGGAGVGKKMLAKAMAKHANCTYIEVDLASIHNSLNTLKQTPPSLAEMIGQYHGAVVAMKGYPFKNSRGFDLLGLLIPATTSKNEEQSFDTWILQQIKELQTYSNQTIVMLLDHAHAFAKIKHWQSISLSLPSNKERMELIETFSKGLTFADDCDFEEIAYLCEDFSPKKLKELFLSVSHIDTISQDDLKNAAALLADGIEIGGYYSPAVKIVEHSDNPYSLSDIIGYEALTERLESTIFSLNHPGQYKAIGTKPSRILFLTGSSGSGKTMMAHIIAKESNRTLIHIDATRVWEDIFDYREEFDDIYEIASNEGPCVICIDNFDHYNDIQQYLLYDFINNKLARQIKANKDEEEAFVIFVATDKENLHQEIQKLVKYSEALHIHATSYSDRLLMLETFSKEFVCDPLSFEELALMTTSCTPADLKDLFHLAAKSAVKNHCSAITQEGLIESLKLLNHIKASNSDAPSKLFNPLAKKTTFADIGGCTEVKEDLEEIIAYLKNPSIYENLGVKAPRGILMTGPPGCGKTLLARAVAGEAGCNFFYCSGSDMNSKYMHEGGALIHKTFQQARENAPAVLFIDEIDSVGGKRLEQSQAAAADYNNSVNQLLVEMDGFEQNDRLIVIAATNRLDLLDPALLRPGRFDRKVNIGLPTLKDRGEILKVHAKGRRFAPGIDWKKIAKMTIGMNGSELEQLLNEAAMLAARNKSPIITMSDVQEARDRVQLGPQKKNLLLTQEEKRNTAYHEVGHTIVGYLLECSEIVDKVTILPRADALGITFSMPRGERTSLYRTQLHNDLAMALGGHAAELLFLSDVSTGATSDIQYANKLARHMICECGMSERLGFLSYDHNLAPETMRIIDEEIITLLDQAFEKAKTLLQKHQDTVEILVAELLEKETLYREDLDRIIGPVKKP